MQILVVGTGYVGLVQAAGLVTLGHQVAAVDIDDEKVEKLKEGEIPFYEPGLKELVEGGLHTGKLTFHIGIEDALSGMPNPDVVFVCVPTPRRADGSCDLSSVFAVAKDVGSRIEKTILCVKSTVPPGSRPQLRERLNNDQISIASNPEFLREGSAVSDFMRPDRIVIGTENEEVAEVLEQVYQGIDAPILTMSVESAQIAKYAANTMLAARLSLVNEIANIADVFDASMADVKLVLETDPRIGKAFLRSGAGFGGSCFPKDVIALSDAARREGYESKLIDPVIEVNEKQAQRFVVMIEKRIGPLHGKRLAIWGLAFNKGTDDVRESPSLRLIPLLLERGAKIVAHDPKAALNAKKELGEAIEFAEDPIKMLDGKDALLVMTEWDEYRGVHWQQVASLLSAPVVFDGKSFLDADRLALAGLSVYGIGLCKEATNGL
ncbi:MAG: UDP-glucose/GDP-mannose dehydrogenase family protein [bacterium]|nr:UDP-glucose/GDP-mannose dehydrogenase family protein [bacterium]